MADQAAKKQYRIIMEKVPADKQTDAALFLSGCFSLPQASTKGIAASGPIALVTDIEQKQAEAIMAELSPVLPEGVVLRVADDVDKNVSRLQWPRPPRVYGRELDEFARDNESHDARCPICGGMLRITPDGGSVKLAAVVERRRGDTLARSAPTNDLDPLFSGVKPMATETSNFASIRSLQAGDTGFWMDYGKGIFAPPAIPEATPPPGKKGGDSSVSKRAAGKNPAGLSAFMKPGVFAVVVGRTHDAQAVKMIAEIMGLSDAEARDKALNLGLCVARDIALDEAQTLLARFRNLGARVRIVKPM